MRQNLTPESAHRDDLVPGLPEPENRRFYPALDGLRALAVTLVFFQHYPTERIVLRWGWTGVDLFFVLSGFLITGILYDTRDEPHRYRNFYARRALRIFPLFYAVLLLLVALYPLFHWIFHPALLLIPLYLGNYARFLFLHDYLGPLSPTIENPFATDFAGWLLHRPHMPLALPFSHLWSLCIEEQFYLVWPGIVFAVRSRLRLRNICLAVLAACLVLRLICALTLPQPILNADLLYRVTPFRVDALLLGGLVALLLRGPHRARVERSGAWLIFAATLLFGTAEAASWTAQHRLVSIQSTGLWMSTAGFTVLDLFCAGIVLICIRDRSPFASLMKLPWPRKLGQISYGFYILHYPLQPLFLWIARHLLSPHLRHVGPVYLLLAFLSTVLLSWLSFRFFETPFLRLKSRFAD